MAIGQSRLHELVKRRRLLSDSLIWFELFDPTMKQFMIDLVQRDQLKDKGIDADGDVIGFYSALTASINPIKKFNTHYTLEDTGDFYRSMFIQVLSDRVLIEANSQSFNEMQDQDWYSDRILNWTSENIQKIKEELKPKYIAAVKKALFGNR